MSIAEIVLYCLSFQVPAKELKALWGHCGLDQPRLLAVHEYLREIEYYLSHELYLRGETQPTRGP